MDVTLPDGTTIEGVPEGTTKAQIADKLNRAGREVPKEWMPSGEKSLSLGELYKEAVGGTLEPLMQMATGAIATPISGYAAMFGADAGKVQENLTYQPRTQLGRAVSETIAVPFQKLEEMAKGAGEWTYDKTGNPALAAAVGTAINMLPALILEGAGALRAAKGVRATANAETLAQQAATKAGMDWTKVPGQIRAQIVNAARSASEFSELPPEALQRQQRMQSHPVPVQGRTGQLTQNPAQMTMERDIAQMHGQGGQIIRQSDAEQNAALIKNLDTMRSRTGARIPEGSAESQGGAVQLAARTKLAAQEAKVSRLYKKARAAGETDRPVKVNVLEKFYEDNPVNRSASNVRTLLEKAKNKGKVAINDLEEIRKELSSQLTSSDGPTRHDAGTALKVVDSILDNTEAGPLYREARAARKMQGAEFERQGSVEKLVSEKGRTTDNRIALEDTWKKTVLGGSVQDLRNVVRSFQSAEKGRVPVQKGVSVDVKTSGRTAIKEMAGQTIDYLKEQATSGRGHAGGESLFSDAGFAKALDRVGRPKLEILLGKTVTDELFSLSKTAQELLVPPGRKVIGSNTASKLANLISILDKVPYVRSGVHLAVGAAKAARGLRAEGASDIAAQRAVETPFHRPYQLREYGKTSKAIGRSYALGATAEQGQ